MKQVKRYAVFYCAVLLSVIFINNTLYRGMAAGVSFFAIMIIQSVENTRFVDFMQQHCQQEYFEMKNSGFKRAFIWDFAKRNSKKPRVRMMRFSTAADAMCLAVISPLQRLSSSFSPRCGCLYTAKKMTAFGRSFFAWGRFWHKHLNFASP